jgi:hypothetical protein
MHLTCILEDQFAVAIIAVLDLLPGVGHHARQVVFGIVQQGIGLGADGSGNHVAGVIIGIGAFCHPFHVCPGDRNAALSKDFIRSRLKTIGTVVGVKVYPHRLRHTCGTQLLNAGCRITSIQAFLGHKKLNTTMIYARVHDQTVAGDYYQAMGSVERRLDCSENLLSHPKHSRRASENSSWRWPSSWPNRRSAWKPAWIWPFRFAWY